MVLCSAVACDVCCRSAAKATTKTKTTRTFVCKLTPVGEESPPHLPIELKSGDNIVGRGDTTGIVAKVSFFLFFAKKKKCSTTTYFMSVQSVSRSQLIVSVDDEGHGVVLKRTGASNKKMAPKSKFLKKKKL